MSCASSSRWAPGPGRLAQRPYAAVWSERRGGAPISGLVQRAQSASGPAPAARSRLVVRLWFATSSVGAARHRARMALLACIKKARRTLDTRSLGSGRSPCRRCHAHAHTRGASPRRSRHGHATAATNVVDPATAGPRGRDGPPVRHVGAARRSGPADRRSRRRSRDALDGCAVAAVDVMDRYIARVVFSSSRR